jgi:peptidoglycan/LPS O-acetylase OafA/YrhL
VQGVGNRSLGYRPELDGLRAVAVASVLLYHLGSPIALGGFVGVDVFFVLSGFLITRLIAEELRSGEFSLFKFYERRIRRIAPAFFVVCACCMVAALIFLLPQELKRFSSSLIAAVFSLSNVWFYAHSSYFASAGEVRPLLHTWSLGVEEQFYILFPIMLAAAFKYAPCRTGALVWCVFAVSLILSVTLIDEHPKSSFFLIHTRAWELLAGGVIALGLVPAATSRWQRELGAIAGLIGIAAAIVGFNSHTPFPGYAALLPCLGAALIIWAGEENAVARVLSATPFVFIGLISYSLYLWHWPLIVFSRLWVIGPFDLAQQILLTSVAVGLSIATWHFVETPFRRRDGRGLSRRTMFTAVGVGLGALAGCGLILIGLRGLPGRIPKDALVLASASFDSSPMRSKCHFEGSLDQTYGMSCVFGAPVEPDFIVYADSHGAELSLVLGKLAGERGQSVRELTASGCAPTVDSLPEDDPECAIYNARMLKKLTSIPAATVIVTANASAWSSAGAATYIPGMQKVVHALRGAGHRVILLGSVPQHPNGVPIPATLARRAMLGERPEDYTFDPRIAHFRDIEAALEKVAAAEHVEYVPVYPLLCDENRCKGDIGGTVLYFDHGHLSMAGEKMIATKLLAPLLWPPDAVVQGPSELQDQIAQ